MGANRPAEDLVGFAQAVLDLLDRARFTSTYKYAVILAILDLCLEATSRRGETPETLTTYQIAEKCLELYWNQARAYQGQKVLRQNAGNQAFIISTIEAFRRRVEYDRGVTPAVARLADPDGYRRLVQKVEYTLIRMPLPKLQRLGSQVEELIYTINWDDDVKTGEIRRYQRGEASDFDNCVRLLPGVGRSLVQLNGLLRPLLHREWASRVARLNSELLENAELEKFLFGATRVSPARLRQDLADLQDGACFYCSRSLRGGRCEVDHFIPWARHPNDSVENLVVVDAGCNLKKRDFLAATVHLERWHQRFLESGTRERLAAIAASYRWESDHAKSLGIARSVYLNLTRSVRLWQFGDEFETVDHKEIRRILAR